MGLHEERVGRLVIAYAATTDSEREAGKRWYADARSFVLSLAFAYDKRPEQIAAAVAHLSPRNQWKRNKAMTVDLLQTGTASGLRGSIRRALDALESGTPLDTLKGLKVRAFAANMLGDTEAVTVDMWAALVAGVDIHTHPLNARDYREIADAYRVAAHALGVEPAHLQAALWVAARGRAE